MARVCIVCGKESRGGHKVEDDFVICGIRRVKRALKMAKNNELVVGNDCLEEYRKKRQKYERTLMTHAILAALVFLLVALLPIFTSGFSIYAVLLGALLALMILGLAILSHVPKATDVKMGADKGKRRKGKK